MANFPIKIIHVSSSSEVIYQLLAENHQFLCGANFIKMFFSVNYFLRGFSKNSEIDEDENTQSQPILNL